jgi:hypothetical protein
MESFALLDTPLPVQIPGKPFFPPVLPVVIGVDAGRLVHPLEDVVVSERCARSKAKRASLFEFWFRFAPRFPFPSRGLFRLVNFEDATSVMEVINVKIVNYSDLSPQQKKPANGLVDGPSLLRRIAASNRFFVRALAVDLMANTTGVEDFVRIHQNELLGPAPGSKPISDQDVKNVYVQVCQAIAGVEETSTTQFLLAIGKELFRSDLPLEKAVLGVYPIVPSNAVYQARSRNRNPIEGAFTKGLSQVMVVRKAVGPLRSMVDHDKEGYQV